MNTIGRIQTEISNIADKGEALIELFKSISVLRQVDEKPLAFDRKRLRDEVVVTL